MSEGSPEAGQVVEFLESLSNQEGYDEAAKIRRDVIDAHGGTLSWDSLSEARIAEALQAWLVRRRWGNAGGLEPLPQDEVVAAAAAMKAALERHRETQPSAQALSVDAFGDTLQALWTALSGEEAPEPEPQGPANGHFRGEISLSPKG